MSTPTDIEAQVSLLHNAYQKLTGLVLNQRGICDHRQRTWYEFIKAGFTVHDLELVVLHLKHHIRMDGMSVGVLRFHYLIERLDRFEEWLAEAKAVKRNFVPAPSHKEQFVHARIPITGPVGEKSTAVPIAQIAAEVMAKGFEEMRKAIR